MCIFGSQTFVPTSWMCKKQTSVSQFYRSWGDFSRCRFTHGWDSRSRSSGLGEWSQSSPNKTKDVREPRGNLSATPESNMRKQIPTTNTNPDLTNIDHVPSSGTHSGSTATRHVSRNHRVALDWLFDRIDSDSKHQIRYTDTKHQLADILTRGNFARDEQNNLLHLFNISHFSSTCCTKNFSLLSCPNTMATRMQE